MGRKKITIEPITDERNRHVTFNKRKSGLIKKAMELSILCNCQISFLVFNAENQLFEYCSTDPRLILQQYCKVAHLPHERLSNADYSRFDKASRGTKGGRGKKGQTNDNSLANESSNDMSQHAMKQEEVQQHMQRRASISFMDQQQQQQLQQQQYVEQMQQQRRGSMQYADPSMLQQQQQQQQQLNMMNNMDLLTPNTMNTVEMMMQQNGAAPQSQQEQEMQQSIGFQNHYGDQQLLHRSSLEKRKFDQVDNEEYSENGHKKPRHLAPLQVPSNPTAIATRRVDGVSDEAAQQYNDHQWQQQQQQQHNPQDTTGGELTPLGGLFSPIGNLSTPMVMGVADWTTKGSEQSGST
jgi:hypothetical protein